MNVPDIKNHTALEGRVVQTLCALGRPGPCEHVSRCVHEVARSEVEGGKPPRIPMGTNIPYLSQQ